MSTTNIIDKIIVFFSFIAIVVGIFFLLAVVVKKLSKNELLVLVGGVIVSFLVRLKYGLFGPWHAEDHHVELI